MFILVAGTPGFALTEQVVGCTGDFKNKAIYIFVLCNWRSAWSLLYKPLIKGERQEIKRRLKVKLGFKI
jgi:hypothetical protein